MNIKTTEPSSELDNPAPTDISRKSFLALVWNYCGTATSMLSQFVIGIVLARLLNPEAFGIFAIGLLVVSIGNLIVDFGLSVALIQGKNITERDVSFVFTMHIIFGAILTIAGYISAGSIALFFHHPNATSIIQAMSLLFFIQAFGQSAGALLRRSMNFKAYQTINIVSYVTGYVLVGIPCALNGLGAWSLVTAQLTQAILFSLMAVLRSGLAMRPTFKPTNKNLFSFGGKVICINLSNWGLSNLDSLLVGRFLGVNDLGIYNRAMVLIATPINTVTGALQGVLLSACSRVGTDINQIRKAYLGACSVVGFICLPLCLTVAGLSGTIITVIYGDKWATAIPVFQPLALTFAINALLAITGPILTAQNRLTIELRAEAIALLLMFPLIFLMAQKSVVAVAWAVLFVSLVRWGLLLYALSKSLDTKFQELLKPVGWPLVFALIIAGLSMITDWLLKDSYPLIRLVGDVATAALCMVVLLLIFGKKIMKGPHGNYLMAHISLPVSFQRWLGLVHE